MTREEIIQAISDDETMPFIQPDQLANIVDFVIKNYNPFLSSNLEEAANNFALLYDMGTCDGIAQDCFIAGAEFQRKQDQQLIELAEDHAMLAGMNKMREEMLKKAVEHYVIGEIAGHPVGPAIVHYDENLNIGDKVKVIIVRVI